MKKLRNKLLKSKLHWFFIFTLVAGLGSYLLSSALGKAKPIEKFSIFVSGIDFDVETLNDRILSYKTEKYDYILVFECVKTDEDDTSSYYSYDYQFENDAISNSDLIIYSQAFFESTYTANGYKGHFKEITNPKENWNLLNPYAVKVHNKTDNSKDDILGITFKEDNYLISINNKSVHYNSKSDAALHFIEAFIHD